MKTLNRKAFVLMLSAIVLFISVAYQSAHQSSRVHADALVKKEYLERDIGFSQFVVASIEEDLSQQGTSIIDGLYDQRAFYLNELGIASQDEQENILRTLNTIEAAIVGFEGMNYMLPEDSCFRKESFDIYSINSSGNSCMCDWTNLLLGTPCTYCVAWDTLSKSVAAIATGFYVRGWTLASNLMWYNLSRPELDSRYTPSASLVSRVALAPQILNEVALMSALSSGYKQASPSRLNGLFASTIEGDVFNSFGTFIYSKSFAGNGSIKISIIDRYDWDRGDSSPGGVFLEVMTQAQEMGVVVPFCTAIDIVVPGVASLSWEYLNSGVSIAGAPNASIIEIPALFHDLRVNPSGNTEHPKVEAKSINSNSFNDCSSLTTIVIPASVNSISSTAFTNCDSLSTVTIRRESWMPLEGSCSHASKSHYMYTTSYHWLKCNNCYKTFRESHTEINGYVDCSCGFVHTCNILWRKTSTSHSGTCAICGVYKSEGHSFVNAFVNDKIITRCSVCFYVYSGTGPIQIGLESVPIDADELLSILGLSDVGELIEYLLSEHSDEVLNLLGLELSQQEINALIAQDEDALLQLLLNEYPLELIDVLKLEQAAVMHSH